MPGKRFLIVSHDAVFCNAVRNGLSTFPQVEMILNVGTQREAENKISRSTPTVMLIDVDSVATDALTIKKMTDRFIHVLPVLTANREMTARMLIRGGVQDFVQKPVPLSFGNVDRYLRVIFQRIDKVAAQPASLNYKDVNKSVTLGSSQQIVAIAASTGGVQAIEKVIRDFSTDSPPILLVQHMPSGFTKLFAERLNGIFKLNIKEAQTGDYLLQGQMLIAPAGFHMKLISKQGKLAVDCFLGNKMHGVMPAADILFESMAPLVRQNAIGVVLTGMGSDGARGLMQMHNQGAKTIIQNEATCVVYGMPGSAKNLGAADYELPLESIGLKIKSLLNM